MHLIKNTNAASFALRYIGRRLFKPSEPASLNEVGLFSGQPQHQNFCRIDQLAPVSRMPASSKPYFFPQKNSISLPEHFSFEGEQRSTEQFLIDTDTAALLVLVNGEIRYERYLLTGGREVNWLAMSVSKSFISTLVGIALEEGFIASLDKAISDYVPVKKGSAYDGVTIRQVLQMSSGARWNEDYNDEDSEVFQMGQAALNPVMGLNKFVAQMAKEHEPDSLCRYNSGDTQILGALLERATGRTVSSYMSEKLAEPLGFESPGYWITDIYGTELAFSGLNLTARDYAKFGELFRNKGRWLGKQIISENWVNAATSIDSAVRDVGQPVVAGHPIELGYGYQWWIPEGNKGDYSAVGVLNQLVYVNPEKNTTIVKLSANRKYGIAKDERTDQNIENIEFLRTIANNI